MLAAFWPGRLQRVPETHPDARLLRVVREHRPVLRDGFLELADAAEDRRLEIAQPGIRRIVGEQRLRFAQRGFGLVRPMQHHRVVLPRHREARRELETARQQRFRIGDAADARRDFGEHADGGDVGGIVPQVLAQQAFRVGDAVLAQRQRRNHELRIARRMPQMLRESLVGGLAHLERAVVIRERAPGIRQSRASNAPRGAAPRWPHRRCPAARARDPRSASASGWSGITLRISAACSSAARRIAVQQARGVHERHLESAEISARWCRSRASYLAAHFFFAVPARSLTSRYHISRPS